MTCFSVESIGFTTLQSLLFIEQEPLNFKTSCLTLTFDHGTLNMNRYTCTNAKLVTFKELPVNNEHMNFCVEIIGSTWTDRQVENNMFPLFQRRGSKLVI